MILTVEINRIMFSLSFENGEFYHNRQSIDHRDIAEIFWNIFRLDGVVLIKSEDTTFNTLCDIHEFIVAVNTIFKCDWLLFKLTKETHLFRNLSIGTMIDILKKNDTIYQIDTLRVMCRVKEMTQAKINKSNK